MKLTKEEKEIFVHLGNKQQQWRLGKCSQLSSEEYRILCELTKKNIDQ